VNKLSAQDRASLIRLASSLPAGDEKRKVILAGLSKVTLKKASQNKLIKSENPRLFNRNDWNGYAGAEAWLDAQGNISHQPWTLDAKIFGFFKGLIDFEEPDEVEVKLIADSEGLWIELEKGDGMVLTLSDSIVIEPADGPGELKSLLRSLLSGRVPGGFN